MSKRLLVGLPAWHGEAHLGETLRSLQAQSFRDFEVLISVDDGDQATAAAAEPFLADPRFRRVIQPRRLHWAGSMNWLWAQNDADYFIYHQQDDLLDPRYLETLLTAAARCPEAAVTFSDMRLFGTRSDDVPGIAVEEPEAFARVFQQLKTLSWNALRGAVRADALRAAAPLRLTEDESFCEDFTWSVRIAGLGRMLRVPEPLYFKRTHAGSIGAKWFGTWPAWRRRRSLLTVCVSLLHAALPAARGHAERFALLNAVLERLVLQPFILPVNRLCAEDRAVLIRDLFVEMRREPDYDPSGAFGLPMELLLAWALFRFGLGEPVAMPAGATQTQRAALAAGNDCIRERIRFPLARVMDARDLLPTGAMAGAWGGAEPAGVWTHGEQAELLLWPERPGASLLALQLRPFLADWRPNLRLRLQCAGNILADWTFDESHAGEGGVWTTARLPPMPDDVPLRLVLEFPELERAKTLGMAEESPMVGICLKALSLR